MRLGIRLEVEFTVEGKGEGQAVPRDPMTAEHAADLNGSEALEDVADGLGVHAADQAVCSLSGLAGVMATDSPQPQADVWLGLLNTNWDDIFVVWKSI